MNHNKGIKVVGGGCEGVQRAGICNLYGKVIEIMRSNRYNDCFPYSRRLGTASRWSGLNTVWNHRIHLDSVAMGEPKGTADLSIEGTLLDATLHEDSIDAVTGQKRKRKQLSSCDSCRHRRVKCIRDDATEVCQSCRIKGIKCTS